MDQVLGSWTSGGNATQVVLLPLKLRFSFFFLFFSTAFIALYIDDL